MFFGFAVMSLFIYQESGPILSAAMMAFFAYMTYRGAVLCRYLNVEFHLERSNIRFTKGEAIEQHPLPSVRFKFEDWIQIVSVYNLSGDLLFAIDYIGQDIEQLKLIVQNNGR